MKLKLPTDSARLQSYTFLLSLLTAVIIGGWAIVKFVCVTLPASESDRGFKDARSQVARIEAKDKTTPVLGVVPSVSVKQNFSDHKPLLFPTVKVVLENLGQAPIHLGKIQIAVQEATANPDLETVLLDSIHDKSRLASTTSSNAPTALAPDLSNEGLLDERDIQPSYGNGPRFKPTGTPTGLILGINPRTLKWKTIQTLTQEVPLNFELRKLQKRSISFDYVLELATKPKWYRFVITTSPPSQNNSWKPYKIDFCIPAGDGLPELNAYGGPGAAMGEPGGYGPTSSEPDLSAPPFPISN